MKIEILDDETITLDDVKYVRVGEPSECEKDVVTTTLSPAVTTQTVRLCYSKKIILCIR